MHYTNNLSSGVRALVFVMVAFVAYAAQAANVTAVIDTLRGPEIDDYAVGRLINGSGSMVATWALQTSVSGTDFSNFALTGGGNGLQYTFINEVAESADENEIVYSVSPLDTSTDVTITLEQSPYFGTPGTWNGGNTEAAQFVVNWAGSQTASVIDPDNQLLGLNDGDALSSGSTVTFSSFQVLNNLDSWGIELPTGVNAVQVIWSSSDPSPNSALSREWLTFSANVSPIPEPASGALLGMAFAFVLGLVRKRNR